jgi:hypothetical protein
MALTIRVETQVNSYSIDNWVMLCMSKVLLCVVYNFILVVGHK